MRALVFFVLCLPLLLTGQSDTLIPPYPGEYDFPASRQRTYTIPAAIVGQVLRAEATWATLTTDERFLTPLEAADSLNPHRLTIDVDAGGVTFSYAQHTRYHARAERVGGKMGIRLYGPNGEERSDAQVTSDGKRMRYDRNSGAYLRRDWRSRYVRVVVDGDTLFYGIREELYGSRLRHDLSVAVAREPVSTIVEPYYFLRRAGRYLHQGIRNGYWYDPPYPFAHHVNRIVSPAPFTGYVTTDQPKYRPGDTVTISAYVTYPRGRPLRRDSLRIFIGNGHKQARFRIGRTEPGRYVTRFPLPADWPLDYRYRIDLYPTGLTWREVGPSISFQLTDYELDEYQLAVTTSDTAAGEVWLDVTTTDVNKLPLPDGGITVTATVAEILSSRDSLPLTLPDTLFVHQEATDNRTDRRIVLPDNLFPRGFQYGINLAVTLTAPSGERQTKEVSVVVDRLGDDERPDNRQIPPEPLIRWDGNTLGIAFDNPAGQAIRWTLLRESVRMASGDETGTYRQPGIPPATEFDLHYRYLAEGSWQYAHQAFTAPDPEHLTEHGKVLRFTLDQPSTVTPGATVRMTVQAEDQRGKPAAGVRLSSGTYNVRFDKLPVTLPTYRDRRRRRTRQEYSITPLSLDETDTAPPGVITALGLDTAAAYRLRYPGTGYTHLRDLNPFLPDSLRQSHYAPFVVRDHALETIRAIHVDDRLMHWYHPNLLTPYSLAIPPGTHTISLRTDQARYTKEVMLRPRTQLVESFSAKRAGAAGWRVEPLAGPTERDIRDITDRALVLTGMQQVVPFAFRSSANEPVQLAVLRGPQDFRPVGLATDRFNVEVWLPGLPSLIVPFESGFQYDLSARRDRLYPFDVAQLRKLESAPATGGPAGPGIPIFEPPSFEYRPRTADESPGLPDIPRAEDRSRLQLTNLPDSLLLVAIQPLENDSLKYRLHPTRVNTLNPGNYRLLFLQTRDRVSEKIINLIPHHLHVEPATDRTVIDSVRFNSVSATAPLPVLTTEAYVYEGYVSGRVVDETGEGLIGVNILAVGTTYGTVTDLDGHFSLAIPAGVTKLRIAYLGYEDVSVRLRPGNAAPGEVVVTLQPASQFLEEVVVIGYGTVRKNNLTGSVVTVRGLAGRAAGVRIQEQGPTVYRNEAPAPGRTDTVGRRISIPAEPTDPLRSNFSDRAAFHPHLRTDRQGRAVFDVTFPDDITAWNTYAVGQDRRRRIGFTSAFTQAYKDLQAQLYLPRFLVAGDRSEAVGLAINRRDSSRTVRLTFAGTQVQETDTLLRSSVETRYPITAPESAGEISYAFRMQSAEAGDGEERTVEVFPQGVEMTAGRFFYLDRDTTDLPTDFIEPDRGPLTLRLLGNRVEQLLADVEYVTDYPYDCLEQTASRLIGLLALQRIERARGRSFTRERDIRKMIARLDRYRRPDGGYGWWPDSDQSSVWITHHAYRALSAAARAGYPTAGLEPVRRYLLQSGTREPDSYLDALLTLTEENPEVPPPAFVFGPLNQPIGIYRQLVRTRLRQLRGDTIDLDTLLALSTPTSGDGRYWGVSGSVFLRQPLHESLAATLLARRIFLTAGRPDVARTCVNYLLGNTDGAPRAGRLPTIGRNTLASARLLDELLPELLKDGQLAPPTVQLHLPDGERRAVTTFPYLTTLPEGEVGATRLARTGSGPQPAVAYQNYFTVAPEATGAGFSVSTRFTDGRGRPVPTLTLGEAAEMVVTVEVGQEADYVLIEAPIPAGCHFAHRSEPAGPYAVHREYRRDRVAIFCGRLPVGVHTYRIRLEPRFRGRYTVNPARAGLQYVPTEFGHSGTTVLVIE